MPELPDVEHYRRVLTGGGMRRAIADVTVKDRRILDSVTTRRLKERLTGTRLVQTRRCGKHLLVQDDKGDWLTFHFGMTGALDMVGREEGMPRHARVVFDFDDGGHLAYVSQRMLGHVGLVDDATAFFREQHLGPDALDSALTRRAFVKLLAGRRGSLKSALMNQGIIAGIGNVYADEILFQADLHPTVRLDTLDDSDLGRVYRAMRRVLEVAVKHGAGSERFLDRLPRTYLLPQRVKGGKCPRCGTPLRTVKAGGRTSWFCPRHQPA